MRKILSVLITALLFAGACSKKEKKYIPFTSSTGDSSVNVSRSATGASLTNITVSPADQSVAKGTQAIYKATGIYSDGTTLDITNQCDWTVNSETDKVSAVDSPKGNFLGVGLTSVGTPAQISAGYNSIAGNASLNVTAATLSSIQITAVPSLVSGGTVQYYATGIFSDGTTQDISALVTWSSNNSSGISIDSQTGIGTGGSSTGAVTITATLTNPENFPSVANNGTATTSTTVTSPTVVSITITGVSSISAGNTTSYTASAQFSNGTSSDITTQATWSLTNTTHAAINDSVGNKGVLTSISIGSTIVQVSYLGVTGTKPVTISAATVTSVVVSPSPQSIAKGTTTQFTATATYSDGSVVDVTNSAVWSSSNSAVAGVDTSSTTGGTSQAIGMGSATISASIGGQSGSGNLTVTAATLVSIEINGSSSIAKGTTKQYTATGTYTDGSTLDITSLVSWNSSSTGNVAISNGTGTEGLATGAGQGSSTIQASLNGITSNSSTLTVTQATLSSIAIGGNATITAGATNQYTAIGAFTDGTTQDITSLVTWSSSSTTAATISNADGSNGQASAISAGTSSITASIPSGVNGIVTTGGGTIISNSSTLTVNPSITLSSISVSPNGISLPTGFTQQYTAIGTYSNGTTRDITSEVAWSSSSTSIATIGGSTGLATTVATGTTTISATLDNKTGSKTLTVNSLTVSSIYIGRDAYLPLYSDEPTNSNKSIKYYTALATFSNGSQIDVTDVATWTSSNSSVAAVDNLSPNKGKATAVSTGGPTTITASYGGKSGTANLTVNASNYNSVSSTFTSSIYSTVPVNMNVKSSDNVAVSGVTVKIYTSQDINSDVLFQGITNTQGNVTGTVGLTINSDSITVYAQAYKGTYTSSWYPIQVVKEINGTITIILQFGDLVLDGSSGNLNGITIVDSDGDGVEDSLDYAPNDPQIAFKQRYPGKNSGKVFTQSFERDWPKYSTTSTDLNDYVVQYYYEEYLNAAGKVTKILGNFEVVTAIWNTSHKAGLKLRLPSSANVSSFKSERYTYTNVAKDTVTNLTDLTASQLKDSLFIFPQRNLNTTAGCPSDVLCVTGVNGDAPFENPYYGNSGASHGAFYPGDISRVSIQFGAPISRDELGSAPYDVFLFYSDGSYYPSPATKEIHRVGLGYLWSAADQIPSGAVSTGKTQADYIGKDKYLDEWAVFQWAILIPQVWKPGHETTVINNTSKTGYIKYANWVSTKGQQNADWFKDTVNMVPDKIYQIQPLPNKNLCLDCTVGTEAYDPSTLPTTYTATSEVAFMEQVIDEGSKLMAYISQSAESGSTRGIAAAIALLVGAILAGRIWRNARK